MALMANVILIFISGISVKQHWSPASGSSGIHKKTGQAFTRNGLWRICSGNLGNAGTRACTIIASIIEYMFFVNSGSEAVEGALKLAKRFTGRHEIISFKMPITAALRFLLVFVEIWS